MAHRFLALALALAPALMLAAAQVGAQSAKAYAPEDLGKLTPTEQVRVISKQYADLSGGRQIPSDQLEFYLDQVRSGWTFSQISQDIQDSLRPGFRPQPAPDIPVHTPGWREPFPLRGQTIECSSIDGRYQECLTGFRNPPVMAEQLSRQRCIEGQNWGHRPGVVWVHGGCRARFVESAPQSWEVTEVVCESIRGGYRECRLPFRGPVALARQISQSACFEGQTWGQRPGLVWVDRGCRAAFQEAYRGSVGFFRPGNDAYAIDCQSINGAYLICNWNDRWGQPYLLEQYSLSPCIEGRSWGYSPRRGLWVDAGCRGRFGVIR